MFERKGEKERLSVGEAVNTAADGMSALRYLMREYGVDKVRLYNTANNEKVTVSIESLNLLEDLESDDE